ncbi:putative ribonuclease H-like domain-containing protein [Tanacetum coccineum]
MTYPSPKRSMVSKAVLMRSGLLSPTTARPVNTAQPRTIVNSAIPITNVFNKAHSTVRRPINNNTTSKNSNFNQRVNTVKDKNVNTVRPKAVVMLLGQKQYLMLFRETREHVPILLDYEEINEDYVAFGGNPKGGKITGRVPRKNNMYSVDLKNSVPKGGLTCLFAKATSDESKLWHRRLGHINFKTMNKLVKGNLIRGLPSKLFENDQNCVACQKGKQHRSSCKSKTISSIIQPLHMLHMDLFGPTFVKSLMIKMYCLVVTDDYSRFSWVFFLATKDETSGILKSFITVVENLIDQRVKVIRCDNGTKFKNKEMNQFCERKGIKREFSVARTPQQNEVAERKNRTLIKAARTMLADSKLPTIFWAEAVNTACYVQNRVLVTKPHKKTPYELFLGRKLALGFMRPFGCPVIILNTIDHLGKFDGKADEGFFVGYSINSKAFRSMNYKPVVAENQSNGNASTKACDDASKPRMETLPGKDYILLPLWPADLPFSQNSKSSPDAGFKPSGDNEKKVTEKPGKEDGDPSNNNDSVNKTNNINTASDGNNTNNVNTVSSTVNTAGIEVNAVSSNTSIELPNDPNMPELEDIIPIPTTRIHKDHPVEQIIRDLNLAPQTRRMTKNLKEHGLFSSVQQRKNHKDFQNCLRACFLSQEKPKKGVIDFPHGRIDDIDANEDIYLVNVNKDEDMFGVNDLEGDEVIVETEVDLRCAKPKADKVMILEPEQGTITTTTAAITVTAASTRPKAKGLVIHEEEQATTPIVSSQQPSHVKVQDKGKRIMIEEPLKMKKKDQVSFDDKKLNSLQEEFDGQWRDFAGKHFVAKRVEEKRNRAPTRAQQRSIMCTYLKNMEGWKPKSLKSKFFANIQELFDKAIKRVNTFVDYRTEVEESSKKAEVMEESFKNAKAEIAQESSSKRAGEALEQESSKKAKTRRRQRVNFMDNFILNLKTMFEHHVEDSVWKNQQGLVKVLNWKLYDSCGVHCVTMQNILYYLLVEKRYPLTNHTLHQMFNNVKLQVDYECEMAFELLRLVKKHLKEGYVPE